MLTKNRFCFLLFLFRRRRISFLETSSTHTLLSRSRDFLKLVRVELYALEQTTFKAALKTQQSRNSSELTLQLVETFQVLEPNSSKKSNASIERKRFVKLVRGLQTRSKDYQNSSTARSGELLSLYPLPSACRREAETFYLELCLRKSRHRKERTLLFSRLSKNRFQTR